MHLGHPTWNVMEVVSNLQRLKGHPGFPTGENLRCPIFLQDKFVYLRAMPHKLCLPTLKVILLEFTISTYNLHFESCYAVSIIDDAISGTTLSTGIVSGQ